MDEVRRGIRFRYPHTSSALATTPDMATTMREERDQALEDVLSSVGRTVTESYTFTSGSSPADSQIFTMADGSGGRVSDTLWLVWASYSWAVPGSSGSGYVTGTLEGAVSSALFPYVAYGAGEFGHGMFTLGPVITSSSVTFVSSAHGGATSSSRQLAMTAVRLR